MSYVKPQRADDQGHFTLEGVPAGQMLSLYAEFGPLGGATSVKTPDRADPDFRVSLPLRPLATAEQSPKDGMGGVLASREFTVTPKVEESEFPFLRRTVKSDDQGRLKVDRVVPGLTYRIQEQLPVEERLPGGVFRIRRAEFDQQVILKPE